MRRGDIWTVAGGGDYIGRGRPCVVLQTDRIEPTGSITICPLTTDLDSISMRQIRIPVRPNTLNGLDAPSWIMADKVTTVRRSRLGTLIGQLGDADMEQLEDAIVAFFDLPTNG